MELKERISLILKEHCLNQIEFAALIGVTGSYISSLCSGRNMRLSPALARLIEEKLGYNAQWVLTGEGDKLKQVSKNPNLSDAHKRAILQLEKMNDAQLCAVLAFIDSLGKIETILAKNDDAQ